MRRTLLILPLLALFAGAAQAAIVLRVDVNDLTDTATVVVRGEVLDVHSKWNEDETTIHTLVTLRVDRVLKGKAGKEITITCAGGRVGEKRIPVSGVPTFVKGERAVVFLWKNGRGEFIPLGMNQGKFRIEKDAKTGSETARNSLEGLALVGAPDGRGERRRVKRTADSYGLSDLEKRVTDRVEAARKAAEAKKKKAVEKKKAEASKEKKAPVTDEGKADEKKEPVVAPKKAPEDPKPEEPTAE